MKDGYFLIENSMPDRNKKQGTLKILAGAIKILKYSGKYPKCAKVININNKPLRESIHSTRFVSCVCVIISKFILVVMIEIYS